ncbi:hypothetical protein L209DRAFT_766312 [Thermothelomyces heterothallicus CBS 203.75]
MTHQVKSPGDESFTAKYKFLGFCQEDVVGSDEGEASHVWPQRLPTFINVKFFHHRLFLLRLEPPDSRVRSLSDSQAFEDLTGTPDSRVHSLSDSPIFEDLTSLSSSAFDLLNSSHVRGLSNSHLSIKI